MTQGQNPPGPQGSTPADEQALLYARDLARARTTGPLRRRLAALSGKVLLVDDEAPLRLLVTTTLALHNFDILEADRGEVALKIIWKEHPRLVLLDINLPDVNGIEICGRIKADPMTAHIKVVMLTAAATDKERGAALAAGADAYVTKPFSPLNLMDTVTQLLGESESTRPENEA